MINVTPLNSIYGDNIPSDLQSALKVLEERLNEQKDFVSSVTVMPNCSIDYDRTIHLQKTLSEEVKYVLQGVLVTVKPEYKLSFADAIWFHPEMAKGRSVYNIEKSLDKKSFDEIKEIHHIDGEYDKENPAALSPFHCDVGEYSEISIDDMGLQSEKKQLIVNVSQEALTYSLWTQYLMTGEKVGNVYKNWTEMDMGNGKSIMDTSAYVRDLIAQKIIGCTLHEATSAVTIQMKSTRFILMVHWYISRTIVSRRLRKKELKCSFICQLFLVTNYTTSSPMSFLRLPTLVFLLRTSTGTI